MKNTESKLKQYFDSEILELLKPFDTLDEIRLHRASRIFIRRDNKNTPVDKVLSDDEFSRILDRICRYSYHSYADMIAKGFIPLGDGFRCGVSGVAICDGPIVKSIFPINDIVIRIPHLVRGISREIFSLVDLGARNILIYSKPCEGKTTLIRDIAIRLADYPMYKRVCVADEKNEIMICDMERYSLLSSYTLFPKDKAIAYCVNTLSPDYIICDEIVTVQDADAVMQCFGAGVGIIATTHADSYENAISRIQIKRLYEAGVFDVYAGIKRRKYGFDFEITKR